MSYGVLASKSASVMVETTSGVGGSDSDVALDRFQGIWGGQWVQGRLTVTRLHVNFIPSRAGRGMAMLDLNLRDIQSVEIAGGPDVADARPAHDDPPRARARPGLRRARHRARPAGRRRPGSCRCAAADRPSTASARRPSLYKLVPLVKTLYMPYGSVNPQGRRRPR